MRSCAIQWSVRAAGPAAPKTEFSRVAAAKQSIQRHLFFLWGRNGRCGQCRLCHVATTHSSKAQSTTIDRPTEICTSLQQCHNSYYTCTVRLLVEDTCDCVLWSVMQPSHLKDMLQKMLPGIRVYDAQWSNMHMIYAIGLAHDDNNNCKNGIQTNTYINLDCMAYDQTMAYVPAIIMLLLLSTKYAFMAMKPAKNAWRWFYFLCTMS